MHGGSSVEAPSDGIAVVLVVGVVLVVARVWRATPWVAAFAVHVDKGPKEEADDGCAGGD